VGAHTGGDREFPLLIKLNSKISARGTGSCQEAIGEHNGPGHVLNGIGSTRASARAVTKSGEPLDSLARSSPSWRAFSAQVISHPALAHFGLDHMPSLPPPITILALEKIAVITLPTRSIPADELGRNMMRSMQLSAKLG
jgi:hypothetical protein